MELYISLASLSVLMALMLSLQIRRADIEKEYTWFVMVMVAAAVWTFFSIFSLITPYSWALFFTKMAYLGIISMPVFLLFFACAYSGWGILDRYRIRFVFWIIPSITTALMLTNCWHGWFWPESYMGTPFDGRLLLTLSFGPWYWVHTVYSYALILLALGLLIVTLVQKRDRVVLYLFPVGIALPLASSMAFILGHTTIDYTPMIMAFSTVAFGFGVVNGFYQRNLRSLNRMKEQTEILNRFYQVVLEISGDLIQAETAGIADAMNKALQKLGRFNQVDRVYVFEHDPIKDVVSNTYEWCAEGVSEEKDRLQDLPYAHLLVWDERFKQGKHVYIPEVRKMPEGSALLRDHLLSQQIRSLILVPMFFGERFTGFIGFDSVKRARQWDERTISLLKLAANIIAGNTARLRYEKALMQEKQNAEAANRAKSEFLANISHELRTPLNAIQGFTDLVASQITDRVLRERLEVVLRSSNSLMLLINDLLEFSRAEAGMLQIKPAATDLEKMLGFIQDTFLPTVQNKGLAFHVKLSPAAKNGFMLDGERLRQALFNIVGNAVKFTHQGGIAVQADAEAETDSEGAPTGLFSIRFVVRDTGIGIAPEHHQLIFEPFRQLSTGNTRAYEGTGLGLNIASRMVALMNGRITLESESGKGSTFTIHLNGVKKA